METAEENPDSETIGETEKDGEVGLANGPRWSARESLLSSLSPLLVTLTIHRCLESRERERDVFSRNGFLTAMENVVSSWKGKTKQGFEVLEDEGETSCLFISSRLDIT